jgi:hypothetical protein
VFDGGKGNEHAPKRKLREDIDKGLKSPHELHDWQTKTGIEQTEEGHKDEKADKEQEKETEDASNATTHTKENKPSEINLSKK